MTSVTEVAPNPPPPPTKPAVSAREEHAIKSPQGVKFGRPEKPDLESILKANSWESFYQLCKEARVRGATYEDVILRRLSEELGLHEEQTAALKKLFKAEQELTTRSIVESYGGTAGFERKQGELGTSSSKAVYEEWRRQRDVIRRTQDAEYLKLLTYSQLEAVNEHLRNTEIHVENSYDQDGVHYLIAGAGKPPK